VTDDAAGRWFLPAPERGYTEGNRVRLLVHGATYFERLYAELAALAPGDRVFFTDWRGDADELLRPEGPAVGELLAALARRGVEVRGLLWRSHSDLFKFSARENEHLGRLVNDAGGEALLDQRVRRFGSHHQKLVVVWHADDASRDVAFAGGIDLSHGRRDDERHDGDPQAVPMDRRYGDHPPWHDAMLEVRGPAVADLLHTFVERWNDPTPLDHRTLYRGLLRRRAGMPRHPHPLPPGLDRVPPEVGPHAVQVLRTYGAKRPPYPFAPQGERGVAREYAKAFARARRLVYVEDQYLWSRDVSQPLVAALRRSPDLHVVAVVPRYPDEDGLVSGPPNRVGRLDAIRALAAAGGDRVGVFDVESPAGVPVYVHAKVCVVDDVWFTCGSDNLNRRSWTHDSEVTCAVLDGTPDDREPRDPGGLGDGARRLARDLRIGLWAEHLDRPAGDPALVDPANGLALFRQSAAALDAWHAGGSGPRPPGRVRAHTVEPVSLRNRTWARPVYRVVFDPDGRPRSLRRRREF
jgi:phosphatidylserine/phosphatidylglycerophosphate/cardiolipin synthase-like enzyme